MIRQADGQGPAGVGQVPGAASAEVDPGGAPQQPLGQQRAGAPGNAPRLPGAGTVLVVDDEDCVRDTTGRLLERLGFIVRTAQDGREAVEVFRSHADEIVAVLLDCSMPGKESQQVYVELNGIRADTPVILMSGYLEEQVMSRFLGLGVAGFLQKPFQRATLADKVSRVLK